MGISSYLLDTLLSLPSSPPPSAPDAWALRELLMNLLVLAHEVGDPPLVTRAMNLLINFHVDYGRVAAFADLTA